MTPGRSRCVHVDVDSDSVDTADEDWKEYAYAAAAGAGGKAKEGTVRTEATFLPQRPHKAQALLEAGTAYRPRTTQAWRQVKDRRPSNLSW